MKSARTAAPPIRAAMRRTSEMAKPTPSSEATRGDGAEEFGEVEGTDWFMKIQEILSINFHGIS
jgi:hypothetical protein